jgi:hypothetical protein
VVVSSSALFAIHLYFRSKKIEKEVKLVRKTHAKRSRRPKRKETTKNKPRRRRHLSTFNN